MKAEQKTAADDPVVDALPEIVPGLSQVPDSPALPEEASVSVSSDAAVTVDAEVDNAETTNAASGIATEAAVRAKAQATSEP